MNPYIEVNNNAVKLLQNGNYEAAVPTFLIALDLFKKQVAASVITNNQNFCTSYNLNSRMTEYKRVDQTRRDQNFYRSHGFQHQEMAAMTSTERLHFCNRAFLLSENKVNDPSAICRRDGTSSLILFNIGVSLHGQAIRTGDTKILEKALTVYELALSSADHWEMYSGGKQGLLQMCILNNMALLHSQVMQMNDSILYLRKLRRLVIESPNLAEEDPGVFDWNVVLYMEGRLEESPAPAA